MTVEHTYREPRSETGSRFDINLKAVTVAGLIAGAVFLLYEMILVAATGGWFWGPPHMMAGIAYGEMPVQPGNFEVGIFLVGLAVHFVLSVGFTGVLAFFVHRLSKPMATAVGVGYGFALYVVNFYLFTGLFEWFVAARGVVNWSAHLIFGALAGGLYAVLAERTKTTHKTRTTHEATERTREYPSGAETA